MIAQTTQSKIQSKNITADDDLHASHLHKHIGYIKKKLKQEKVPWKYKKREGKIY